MRSEGERLRAVLGTSLPLWGKGKGSHTHTHVEEGGKEERVVLAQGNNLAVFNSWLDWL